MNWLKKLIQWIKDAFEPSPLPTPTPTPTPTPEPSNDLTGIKWLGTSYAKASATAKLSGATIAGGKLTFADPAPSSWPTKTVKVLVQGIACLFYEVDGQKCGGKFDWTKPGQTVKGLENVRSGYNGHTMPRKPTPAWTLLVSVDGKQRTNLAQVVWK
jgi:hypothetical protein